METENLSNYFKGVAVKRLSAVEADSDRSNQHEFNGVSGLKNIFGKDKRIFETKLIYLGEKDEDAVTTDGLLTWYDARENHPERTEHRLYFPTTAVSENSKKGDLLLIGEKPDGSVLVVVTKANSNIESQILWLFGLQQVGESFSAFEIEKEKDIGLGFGPRFILEELGISIKETNEKRLRNTSLTKIYVLEKILQEADIVTTGEGTMDRQTVMGKGVGELAKMARAKDCRCLGLAGHLEDPLELNDHFEQCRALSEITSQDEAQQNPTQWLEKLAAETAEKISETEPT